MGVSTRLTQTEIIVRQLCSRRGEWFQSHGLSQVHTEWGFIGSEGKRRCRELAEAGKFETANNTYYIERRTRGKYAEYRVAFVVPKKTFVQGVGYMQTV